MPAVGHSFPRESNLTVENGKKNTDSTLRQVLNLKDLGWKLRAKVGVQFHGGEAESSLINSSF